MAKKYNDDGMRLTDCCGSVSTYHDETLVCKGCWGAVPHGQGDGMEGRLEYIDDDQKSVAAVVKNATGAAMPTPTLSGSMQAGAGRMNAALGSVTTHC